MARRPVILVTRGRGPVSAYSDRLRDVGADPVEVAAGEPYPAEFGGLVLSGGPDVDPHRYGQEPNGSEVPDLPRDAFELDELFPLALRRGRPVLAICRGMQVLNVARGGSLVQDIGEAHRARRDDVIRHEVSIDPRSLLMELSGPSAVVNSRHHQVIDRLGSGLRATAWADGHVEAVEATDGTWIVGVQWHPERVQDGLGADVVAIFDRFVRAAGRVPAQ